MAALGFPCLLWICGNCFWSVVIVVSTVGGKGCTSVCAGQSTLLLPKLANLSLKQPLELTVKCFESVPVCICFTFWITCWLSQNYNYCSFYPCNNTMTQYNDIHSFFCLQSGIVRICWSWSQHTYSINPSLQKHNPDKMSSCWQIWNISQCFIIPGGQKVKGHASLTSVKKLCRELSATCGDEYWKQQSATFVLFFLCMFFFFVIRGWP